MPSSIKSHLECRYISTLDFGAAGCNPTDALGNVHKPLTLARSYVHHLRRTVEHAVCQACQDLAAASSTLVPLDGTLIGDSTYLFWTWEKYAGYKKRTSLPSQGGMSSKPQCLSISNLTPNTSTTELREWGGMSASQLFGNPWPIKTNDSVSNWTTIRSGEDPDDLLGRKTHLARAPP